MSKFISAERQVPLVGITLGTRPGIIMLAPVIHELRRRQCPHFVIHTGQHYSPNMDLQMFEDLDLPAPEYRLQGVAERKSHGAQTAAMLEGIEAVLLERRPCLFLVGGDANTNLSGALAARKLRIAVGHIEAGERSFDWQMPEEHNRVMIDHVSDHLFVTGKGGVENLRRESVRGQIHVVGNPIVDASINHFTLARRKSSALDRFGLTAKHYAIVTMHREENVDVPERLKGALQGVSQAAQSSGLPALMLAHPRTLVRLKEFGLEAWLRQLPGLRVEPAVGYLDFLNLLANARMVFTDSGGVQQEACIHQVPCVTLRDNTEWTETLEIGANRLAGCNPEVIRVAAAAALETAPAWANPFGDGTTARQIADVVVRELDRFRSAA
ncbi:non-hydrolyzing UDP-N-acetylglucosamine 2-epimerase [Dongia sp.]|uniref:non-hydrolyzing UDP-N-acetylglucosamine 2-epimerase n=1 Tax=Dongia sp. TaxID=1977262 RepID=UPI0037501544